MKGNFILDYYSFSSCNDREFHFILFHYLIIDQNFKPEGRNVWSESVAIPMSRTEGTFHTFELRCITWKNILQICELKWLDETGDLYL